MKYEDYVKDIVEKLTKEFSITEFYAKSLEENVKDLNNANKFTDFCFAICGLSGNFINSHIKSCKNFFNMLTANKKFVENSILETAVEIGWDWIELSDKECKE